MSRSHISTSEKSMALKAKRIIYIDMINELSDHLVKGGFSLDKRIIFGVRYEIFPHCP